MAGKDKLTDTEVKQAKPRDKPYKLADGGNMYLEVSPDGAKRWYLKYRYGKKESRLSLGVYDSSTASTGKKTSLKAARDKAAKAREQLANGIDPLHQKGQDRLAKNNASANTFEMVAAEWFDKKIAHLSATHKTRTLGLLKNNLGKWLGKRPIGEIEPTELLAALRNTEERGTLETAKRALQVSGQVFRYAIATGKRTKSDPTQALKDSLATPKGKHFAAITEPAELGKLLITMDGYSGSPEVKAALLLSPLLFQRPGEIRQMQWADIDFEKAEWRYLVTKTQTQHIVPLCQQAIDILHGLQAINGRGRYVFPSARGGSRPLSENGVRTALRTLGYTNEQMTPHGFRATARTILDEVLGYRVDWIEHQLAHTVKDANGTAYNRTAHLEGRRTMMQGWADYLDELRAIARGDNITLGNFGKGQANP